MLDAQPAIWASQGSWVVLLDFLLPCLLTVGGSMDKGRSDNSSDETRIRVGETKRNLEGK